VDATQILPTWAFFRGIQGGNLGQGAAIALCLLPLLLISAVLILRSVRKMEVL
jgi:multiple sugar transport system permease protein